MTKTPLVGIIMGSDSDLATMQETARLLEQFTVPYEIKIVSAHRSPAQAQEYAISAEGRGLAIIIAAAGGAAHLAGVVASWTPLPVIGVPMQTSLSGGLDSLLSIVQMPAGVPVATVATGQAGAKNAAVLATQILSLQHKQYRDIIKAYKEKLAQGVQDKNKDLDTRIAD
jgi:5-(carboxyamino)imidazole ribonucleotide mutase